MTKSGQVIVLEMQGHGRTADTDRPYSYAALADDVAGLLKHLEIGTAAILGYSLGATVALATAIRHPALIEQLIFVSGVFRYEGWLKEVRDVLTTIGPELFEPTPLKTEYDRGSDPAHWPAFVTKLAAFDQAPFDSGPSRSGR